MTFLACNVSPRTIDVVDHFSLNQCRTEDITLKENFGNHFLNIEGIGINSELSIKRSCFYIVYAKPYVSVFIQKGRRTSLIKDCLIRVSVSMATALVMRKWPSTSSVSSSHLIFMLYMLMK